MDKALEITVRVIENLQNIALEYSFVVILVLGIGVLAFALPENR